MRYIIYGVDDKESKKLKADVWQGPLASDSVPSEQKISGLFDFTEEGRLLLIEWLQKQYDENTEKWNHAPSLLEAASNLQKMKNTN